MSTSILSPSLVLSLVLSMGIAAMFHLWRGRSLRDLLLYLLVAMVGFGAGQLVGTIIRTPLLQVGDVHLLEASVGAWVALAVAHVVTTPATRPW